jgi:hypothetical protein
MTFLLAILFEFIVFFSIWKPFPFQWHILGHWPCDFPSVWSNDCSFVLRFVHLFVCSCVCCVLLLIYCPSWTTLICCYSIHTWANFETKIWPDWSTSIIFQTHFRKYFLFQLIIVNITHLFQPFYAKYLLI